jgi:hypothetical protein
MPRMIFFAEAVSTPGSRPGAGFAGSCAERRL